MIRLVKHKRSFWSISFGFLLGYLSQWGFSTILLRAAESKAGISEMKPQAADLLSQVFTYNISDAFFEWPTNRFLQKKVKICILHADTRPFIRYQPQGVGQFNLDQFSFDSFNSYYALFYSLIHGYDFKRIKVSPMSDRHHTWTRLKPLYDILPNYDIVVHFDGDAFVSDLSISLEVLMDRWNFSRESHFLQAVAIGNKSHTNCGFWIIRNTPLSRQKLLDLIECPKIKKECDRFRYQFSHEQAAWNVFIRHTMQQGKEFIIVSEREANGWPPDGGKYITHGWGKKDRIKRWMESELSKQMIILLEKFMKHGNYETMYSSNYS